MRHARAAGVHVTCEVTPHHIALGDESVQSFSTNLKMNPPLRSAEHREALLAGIADGTIDAIATDHAPHHFDEKNVEFDLAPFGVIGLETRVRRLLRPPRARRRDRSRPPHRSDVVRPGAHLQSARRNAAQRERSAT